MSASPAATPSSGSVYTTPAFWERLWRASGVHFVVFFIIAAFLAIFWIAFPFIVLSKFNELLKVVGFSRIPTA